MSFSIIVAVAKNGVIGKNNQLPWQLSEDLKYFKATTMGHPILMGRKTYESIGRPLPGRENIILTRQKDLHINDVKMIHNLEDLAQYDQEIFIIGGSEIYQNCLPLVNRIYLTKILLDYEGDVYFPLLDIEDSWKIVSQTEVRYSEKGSIPYQFFVMERRISI